MIDGKLRWVSSGEDLEGWTGRMEGWMEEGAGVMKAPKDLC